MHGAALWWASRSSANSVAHGLCVCSHAEGGVQVGRQWVTKSVVPGDEDGKKAFTAWMFLS